MMDGYFYIPVESLGFHFLDIKIDANAIEHLRNGGQLYCGLYLDDNVHLPQYKRQILKITIGRDLDLQQRPKIFKKKIRRQLIIDKSYLINPLKDICNELKQDFISGVLKNDPISILENKNLSTKEVSKLLGFTIPQIYAWRRKGYFKRCIGTSFDADEIKEILNNPPEWFVKAKEWSN